ncbi:actin-binding protein IPP-like [Dreissena polymorpha]|uniref:actin-binding protein IPP-like n=1 Tax=Dreissena polymorpha TaxID=45954 RepID=UPI002264A4BA|nr:actin-binding protein IPP-like [Dreissena polymorpha]
MNYLHRLKTSGLRTKNYGVMETLPCASTDGLIQVRNEDGPIVLAHLIQVRNEDGPIVLDHQHLYQQTLVKSGQCDVTIIVGDQELKAHWSVLRKYPFFEGLYNSGMKERQEGRVNIGIGESEAVREIMCFMYTSQISLMRSNIQDVLELADYLQLDRLRTMCFDYLRRNVSPSTCVTPFFGH